ncbi:MAG: transposase [Rhodobacteraceae bacterium HLUCCA08]|nr:MAG: transposase [Rhodobacteraceae bacterium HLUCCA08]
MVCDGLGRPLTFFLSPGQMSDAKGALVLLDALPPAKMLLADKGYDADWFREALETKELPPASRPGADARTPPDTTGTSTSNVTGSRTCSPA